LGTERQPTTYIGKIGCDRIRNRSYASTNLNSLGRCIPLEKCEKKIDRTQEKYEYYRYQYGHFDKYAAILIAP
jgi:hypothetical protein